MKIISWNCCGGFIGKGKISQILMLDADIYIIQECEPINDKVKQVLQGKNITNYIWEKGANTKGVLVFTLREDIVLEKQEWDNFGMRVFVPILVNKTFTLVAVWTTKPAYIEEFYIWQLANAKRIDKNTIFFGDFNSSAIWDYKHTNRSHSCVVNELAKKNLVSAYHDITDEPQGAETTPTYLHTKNKNKPFHIDYCFISKDYDFSYKVINDDYDKWLCLSDHFPLLLEIKNF